MKRTKEDKIEGTSELAYPDIDGRCTTRAAPIGMRQSPERPKNTVVSPSIRETGGDMNRGTGTAKEAYAIEGIMKGAAAGKYPY